MHTHSISGGFDEYSHPPSLMKIRDNENGVLEEKSNQRLTFFFLNHLVESKNENSYVQVQDFNFSYTQYKNILSRNSKNEVEKSPPNAHKYLIQHDKVENVSLGLKWSHFDDAKSQEHW